MLDCGGIQVSFALYFDDNLLFLAVTTHEKLSIFLESVGVETLRVKSPMINP